MSMDGYYSYVPPEEKSPADLLEEFRMADLQHNLSWNDLECTNLLLEIIAVGIVEISTKLKAQKE